MKITFADLERDPFHQKLIAALKRENGDPLPDELKEFLVDQTKWSEVVPTQVLEWVKSLNDLVEKLLGKQNGAADYELFWIRLHGLLTEIDTYFAPDSLRVEVSTNAKTASELNRKIKSKFNTTELQWIEHERHCRVHVTTDYYRKTISKGRDGERPRPFCDGNSRRVNPGWVLHRYNYAA